MSDPTATPIESHEKLKGFFNGAAADEQPIDPGLIEKMNTLRNLVAVDNLLTNGIFPGAAAQDVVLAKDFLKNQHTPILKECEEHPDWSRVQKPKPPQTPADIASIDKAQAKRNRKAAKKQSHA